MYVKGIVFLLLMMSPFCLEAQEEGTPQDYLSKEFHKERRAALRAKMPKNSVAVFFANPVRNRANDVDYVYHQDPNFFYLTGYREPHAVLMVFSEAQADGHDEVLYVQEKNAQAEMWTGKRLGTEGTKNILGFEAAYNGKEFIASNYDFKQFDQVMIFDFQDDYRDGRDEADLYSLIAHFKHAANFDRDVLAQSRKAQVYELIKATPIENSANVAQNLGVIFRRNPEYANDELLAGYKNATTDNLRKEFQQKISLKLAAEPASNISIGPLGTLMASLREVKTPEEMKHLKKAVEISAIGQREIMKAMHPGMSEIEIQGVHEFVYKKYGAEYEGYPSIVGAGHNGCVLHYIENTKTKVGNDLVLMDLGAEYHGYTADVTRTIPANGSFSPEQRAIYDLVYEAQEQGIAAAKVGNGFNAPNMVTKKVINEGLLKLGIIKSLNERHSYYPHGSSHHIGLDVHDPGTYTPFKANMVITVEPGIYIPENSPCDKKWWGIAVRIEDDILITDNGPVNLSSAAPRHADEIEALMKEKSVLDSFVLPKLD